MPGGKLTKCTQCDSELKITFETLDLIEYKCERCRRIFTLYHVIKEWPEGTKPARRRKKA